MVRSENRTGGGYKEMSKNLISIEAQSEYSVTTGQREKRIFVKMYVDAVRCGLVGDMGPENWTTLCVIASFMDERGECYPTQAQIAKCLGVHRQTANRYIKRLLAYRWQDRPVIQAVNARDEAGRWMNMRYTVLPVSQLTVFNAEPDVLNDELKPSMSAVTDTVNGDTNKN